MREKRGILSKIHKSQQNLNVHALLILKTGWGVENREMEKNGGEDKPQNVISPKEKENR